MADASQPVAAPGAGGSWMGQVTLPPSVRPPATPAPPSPVGYYAAVLLVLLAVGGGRRAVAVWRERARRRARGVKDGKDGKGGGGGGKRESASAVAAKLLGVSVVAVGGGADASGGRGSAAGPGSGASRAGTPSGGDAPGAGAAVEMQDLSRHPRLVRPTSTTVLTPLIASKVARQLPARFAAADWTLLYSSVEDGSSVQTLFARSPERGATVTLVRDGGGHVFGAFLPRSWRPSTAYFGGGESFVLTVSPEFRVYRWSGKNSFFALGSAERGVSVGGGNGFAFSLDAELARGASLPCDTFDSPTLSHQPDFTTFAVEMWGLSW